MRQIDYRQAFDFKTQCDKILTNSLIYNCNPQGNNMALSFFRALNPTSKDSGIVYCLARGNSCQGTEMIDRTVAENVRTAFNSDLDYFSGLSATYNVLVGQHYDLYLQGRNDSKGGAKGTLDYLIFPLIARKLIADTYLDERRESGFSNALAWIVAIPLELARFSAGIALTLLLAPVIALVHLIKACLPKNDVETTHSVSSLTA